MQNGSQSRSARSVAYTTDRGMIFSHNDQAVEVNIRGLLYGFLKQHTQHTQRDIESSFSMLFFLLLVS